jgi:hypothetical protein
VPNGRIVLTTPHPRAERIHRFGADLGLFSRRAAAEHVRLFNRVALHALAGHAGFKIVHFERLVCGLNQLVVLGRADG